MSLTQESQSSKTSLKREYLELLEEKSRRIKYNFIKQYAPYSKQKQFHQLGAIKSERCLMAGNQLGKTYSGAAEASYHATGLYPADWDGRRFDKPTVGWVGGVSGESIRDSTQKLLVGRVQSPEDLGSTMIPKDCIIDVARAHGVRDLLDHVKIKHVSGGTSLIFFKSYEKGRAKFQAETIDWIWFDEEPPEDIYTEGLTRTNKGQVGQFGWLTYTPLLGMSSVTMKFIQDTNKNKALVNMTIDDVEHYSEEEKQKIIDSYPEHEREARAKGIPTLGSGRIFPIAEEKLRCEPFKLPAHFAQINGLDFGWDHPQACVNVAWDRDADIVYITKLFRASETTPEEAAIPVRRWGDWIPTAWPHDGYQHDKGSGKELASQYRDAGLNMLLEHATHEEGGNGVEAGLMEMLDRMKTGRLKVFTGLDEWFEEFRLYHRKDGKVVKERDDLMAATRYALMMLRFATTQSSSFDDDYDDEGDSWRTV